MKVKIGRGSSGVQCAEDMVCTISPCAWDMIWTMLLASVKMNYGSYV